MGLHYRLSSARPAPPHGNHQYVCHWLRRQVHRCWSRHSRCCWIWSRNWISLRVTHHWIRQEPLTQATALLLCYSGIRPVRSHGSVLFDDGLPAAVRLLDGETRGDTCDLWCILVSEIKLNVCF